MLYISREYVQDSLDKSVAPAAVCDSGETVVFQTRDCYDDSVTCGERPLGDRRDALGNPATGPLYIHGARPGDILKVEILKIELRSWGVMCSSFSCLLYTSTGGCAKFKLIIERIRVSSRQ